MQGVEVDPDELQADPGHHPHAECRVANHAQWWPVNSSSQPNQGQFGLRVNP
jgi:hypothetical protein